MILQNINKTRYRKHLNRVIAVVIVSMLVLTLASSSLLIVFLGRPDESNTLLNFIGLILAGSTVGFVLYRNRLHPYMTEVLYVWRLKQELNAIYRKSAKLKLALAENDHNAFIINHFNLNAAVQLYELDDNDLTLRDLKNELQALEETMQSLGFSIKCESYHRDLLKQLSS